jgi:aromatic ring-opening dioxygenase catalytic subunit (LigB family)
MKLIDPTATVPIVQVSVLASESPAAHYAMGLALSSLREQNVAIIGSGFATMHNLRAMFSGEMAMPAFKSKNIAWSESVTDAATTLDVKSRGDKFDGWRKWADSYTMHPRGGAEHFLPLIVSAGAGAESQGKAYSDEFMGLDFWSYYWE